MSIHFTNRFTHDLPADPSLSRHSRQVEGAAYSIVEPVPVAAPSLLAHTPDLAARLGFEPDFVTSDRFAEIFGGNALLPGMQPFAMNYGGHQFGQWAGQLGDGRAINLGEARNEAGEHWTLQLKGAGRTPYSRFADGLAVLRSSIREFLCSEAMYHLGVPTTRALSLVGTGESVMRDMLYDGHPALEPGAIVCRVAPSFVRFGSFQIFAARDETQLLKALANHVIRADFPELGDPRQAERPADIYLEFFREVSRRTLEMILHWMRVGFVHGVMNTDNMSILGLTIDYGPYGWLDDYDLDWTPNTTDAQHRRYRFGQQPGIAQWNLAQLASALEPLVGESDGFGEIIEGFGKDFRAGYLAMMAQKLGLRLKDSKNGELQAEDIALIDALPAVLSLTETDMTIFFRRLADMQADEHRDTGIKPEGRPTIDTGIEAEASTLRADPILSLVQGAYYKPEELNEGSTQEAIKGWLLSYSDRLRALAMDDRERRQSMNQVNPIYVLRNYMAQEAIDAAEKGDLQALHALQALLRRPYDEQAGMEKIRPEAPRMGTPSSGLLDAFL